jgi:predicted transcriptional regulator
MAHDLNQNPLVAIPAVLHAMTISGLSEALMSDGDTAPAIPGLTAEIVSAYVSHHSIATADIGRLVSVVAEELGGLGHVPEPPVGSQPAVPVRKSVHRDHLVCLVCGKPFKSLRRHLQNAHELTPPAYRERFGLVRDYPMVSAESSEQRAAIARRSGLGQRRPPEPAGMTEVPAEAPPTRGPGGATVRKTMAAAVDGAAAGTSVRPWPAGAEAGRRHDWHRPRATAATRTAARAKANARAAIKVEPYAALSCRSAASSSAIPSTNTLVERDSAMDEPVPELFRPCLTAL